MKFKEILREYAEPKNVSVKKAAELIERDCQPWFKQSKGNFIVFRGYRNADTTFPLSVYENPENRRSRDTPKVIHQIFNRLIEAAGKVANRSNSVFVINSQDLAKGYGPVFLYFPIGNFHYTWATGKEKMSVQDWTGDFEDILSNTTNIQEVMDDYFDDVEISENYSSAEEFFDDVDIIEEKAKEFIKGDDETLYYAVEYKAEIMIHSEKGYLVPLEFSNELLNYLNLDEDSKQEKQIKLEPEEVLKNNPENEKLQMKVLNEYPMLINDIENPSEKVQMHVVKKSPSYLKFINNPTEDVKKYVLEKFPSQIKFLKNPSEEDELTVINHDPDLIDYIKDPSITTQKQAIEKDPYVVLRYDAPKEMIEYAASLNNEIDNMLKQGKLK